MRTYRMIISLLLCLMTAACAQTGDYGDAPDDTAATGYSAPFAQEGKFPTLFASDGARVLQASGVYLGQSVSLEKDAIDPADPDGQPNLNPSNTDSDDGIVELVLALVALPPPASLTVQVTADAGSEVVMYYLNVLIDLDMDGAWGGTGANNEPEWVVKNYQLAVTPGTATNVTPPPFAFSNGSRLPDGAWMRIALTDVQVAADDWDGTGAFPAGEVEDHVIKLPDINGKQEPVLVVNCGGPYKFNGADQIPVACDVININPNAGGNFNHTLQRIDGGVAVGGCLPVPPVAIGPAPATVNIDCTATKGALPSTWLFTATAEDPASQIFNGGVFIGYGAESTDQLSFTDEGNGTTGCESFAKLYTVEIISVDDPSGHYEFTGNPFENPVTIGLNGTTLTVSGQPPFVNVSGTIDNNCAFNATGSGTVAGFPGVTVVMQGSLSESGLIADYTMGANGELPTGKPIIFSIQGN